MLTKFYETWGTARALLVTFTILIVLAMCCKCYGWNLEMEYTGPGSHLEQMERENQDRENERCHDRYQKGSEDSRDVRGSMDWERDHAT